MKEKLAVLICTILISTIAQALTLPRAGDGKLTPEEKAKAIKMLIDSQTEFLSYVEKLSDAQWNARPAHQPGLGNQERRQRENTRQRAGGPYGQSASARTDSTAQEKDVAGRDHDDVQRGTRKNLEVHRDNRSASEGPHARSSVPGIRHVERLPMAALHSRSQFATQQADC